jgi:outer membrane protein assembly factor BamB
LLHPRAVRNGLRILWQKKLQVAVPVVLGGGATCGAAFGVGWLWREFGPRPVAAAATGGGDWPTARGSLERRGAVAGDLAPTRGGVNWTYNKSDKEAFLSSPAIVGNRVYVASANLGLFDKSGKIYCFDADTGAKVWELAPQGYRPTFSSPVVAGHYLVCGEGLHDTNDARVVCIDIRDEKHPKLLWTHATKNHVECTPAIWKDRVVVNAGDDGVHCIALEPVADGKAKVLWYAPGGKYLDCETSLAVHDGKVYVGMGLDGNALVEFDVETGQELRRLDAGAPVFSPPAIADGKLYFVAGYGDYVFGWERARDNLVSKWTKQGKPQAEIDRLRGKIVGQGTICCVDLKSWNIDWQFKTKETVLGAVVVAGEQLFCGARDGHLYCISRAGNLIGSWNSHAPILTSPAVTDKHVCVVNSLGMLYVLDRQSLEPVWQFRLGRANEQPMFLSSPTVARGRVYVGTDEDGLVCVGEPGENRPVPLWPGTLGGAGRAGNADGSILPPEGDLLWNYPPKGVSELAATKVTAPVAVLGEQGFLPVGKGPFAGLTCFPLTAKPLEPAWQYLLPSGVHTSAAVYSDTVWCVDGKPGDTGRHVHALDRTTGKPRWKAPVDSRASGVLRATADRLLVQDKDGELTCLNHLGERQWSQKIGKLTHAPTVTFSMIVAATVQPSVLVVLDRPTGLVLWRRPLEAPPTTSPFVRKDGIYLGTHRGLEARSLLDGAPMAGWKVGGGGVSADFARLSQVFVYVNLQGELVIVQHSDGAVKAKLEGAVPGLSPLVSRNVVLFVGKNGLMRASLQEDRPAARQWLDTSGMGEITAPLVLSSGRIYAATATMGLTCFGKD